MKFILTFSMQIKRFLEWIGLKKALHNTAGRAPYVSEGEMWWVSLGENIGFEINGKSKLFSRPVVIIKKLSRYFYFVIPVTSQHHTGTWYTHFVIHGKNQFACLHQARAVDFRRLSTRIGRLDDSDFKEVKDNFRKLCL